MKQGERDIIVLTDTIDFASASVVEQLLGMVRLREMESDAEKAQLKAHLEKALKKAVVPGGGAGGAGASAAGGGTVVPVLSPFAQFLTKAGFGEHIGKFEAEEINETLAPNLEDSDLRAIGIPTLGARMRLLKLFRDELPLPPPDANVTSTPVAQQSQQPQQQHPSITPPPVSSSTQQQAAVSSQPPVVVAPPLGHLISTGSKFVAPTIQLGLPEEAAHGVESFMGLADEDVGLYLQQGVEAVRVEFMGEHASEDDRKNFDAVMNGEAIGDSEGVSLETLLEHPHAKMARLRLHHVLALRLYTTQSYTVINRSLRGRVIPHPFAATTIFISRGIKMLRAVQGKMENAHIPRAFWRGMKDLSLNFQFLEQGGTELACMSTSENRRIAEKFAGCEDAGVCVRV